MNFWTYPNSSWIYDPPAPNDAHFATWSYGPEHVVLQGQSLNLGIEVSRSTLESIQLPATVVVLQGQSLNLGLALDQPTLESIATSPVTVVTIDSIPQQPNEVVRMLITAAAAANWYSVFGSQNTIDAISNDSDKRVWDNPDGAPHLDIDRVWLLLRSDGTYDLRLNRNPSGVTYAGDPSTMFADMQIFFGAAGPGSAATFHVLTQNDNIEIAVAARRSIGPHFLNLTPTPEQVAALGSVAAGDLINFVIANVDAIPTILQGQALNLGLTLNEATLQAINTIVTVQGQALNLGLELGAATLQSALPPTSVIEIAGQQLSLGLALDQATLESVEPPPEPTETTIDTIPQTQNELVRMLITTTEAGPGSTQWYSRFQGGTEGFISADSDNTIVDDPSPEETTESISLTIDRVLWTDDANNRLRFNRQPPNAPGNVSFADWVTGEDIAPGLALNPTQVFAEDSPAALYSIYIATGDRVVREIPIAANFFNAAVHYLHVRIDDADAQAAFNAVEVGEKINLVIGYRSDIVPVVEVAGQTLSLGLGLGQATLASVAVPVTPATVFQGQQLSLGLGLSQATLISVAVPVTVLSGQQLSLGLALSRATVSSEELPSTILRGRALALGLSLSAATLESVAPPPVVISTLQVANVLGRIIPIRSTQGTVLRQPQVRAPIISALVAGAFPVLCPSKRILLGAKIFPFAGLDYIGNFAITQIDWRRRRLPSVVYGAIQTINLAGTFTDILAAARFTSQNITQFGTYVYELKFTNEFNATSVINTTVVCNVVVGSDKNVQRDYTFRPFSDFMIAQDPSRIQSIEYEISGDITVARRAIGREVLFSGSHEIDQNAGYVYDGRKNYNLVDLNLGNDILSNITDGCSGVISDVSADGRRVNVVAGAGAGVNALTGGVDNDFDPGDEYQILDGSPLDAVARDFEMAIDAQAAALITLYVTDKDNNVSSAGIVAACD